MGSDARCKFVRQLRKQRNQKFDVGAETASTAGSKFLARPASLPASSSLGLAVATFSPPPGLHAVRDAFHIGCVILSNGSTTSLVVYRVNRPLGRPFRPQRRRRRRQFPVSLLESNRQLGIHGQRRRDESAYSL